MAITGMIFMVVGFCFAVYCGYRFYCEVNTLNSRKPLPLFLLCVGCLAVMHEGWRRVEEDALIRYDAYILFAGLGLCLLGSLAFNRILEAGIEELQEEIRLMKLDITNNLVRRSLPQETRSGQLP